MQLLRAAAPVGPTERGELCGMGAAPGPPARIDDDRVNVCCGNSANQTDPAPARRSAGAGVTTMNWSDARQEARET